MTARSILPAAAVAVGLTTSVAAQDGRPLDAWGHRFDVPGAPTVAGAVDRPDTDRADRSDEPRRSYVSGRVDATPAGELAAPAKDSRVIGVWGARIEVPAR